MEEENGRQILFIRNYFKKCSRKKQLPLYVGIY